MYFVDLHKHWLEHSMWRQKFAVRDEAQISRLFEEGIVEVSIDTGKGLDLPPPPPPPPAPVVELERNYVSLADRLKAKPLTVSLGEERRRASRLIVEANGTVTDLMLAARSGRSVDAARLEPIVAKMIESVIRNPDALAPLARLKQAETYAAEHAVAT